ncbi:MAG: exodeoxyribonuclease V subunit alpha [Planctomycetes bacterium]|nr:exodeoxyribonuclease V subunit alpha [Planctomycetota bacterium]
MSALEALREAGALGPLDYWFARFLQDRLGAGEPVSLAGALVCREVAARGVCLDLEAVAGRAIALPGEEGRATGVRSPALAEWTEALRGATGAVRLAADAARLEDLDRPLVLDGRRLYLQRYYLHETRLAGRLRSLALAEDPVAGETELGRVLDALFPLGGPPGDDRQQRRAAEVALRRRLAVITGGPGTGKTTTVRKLVLALLGLRPGIRIALAAPTGKAAHRMSECMGLPLEGAGAAGQRLPGPLGGAHPAQATTLHRLLGVRRGYASFRHDGSRPLPYDAVVVDEASMVDLPLMAALAEALPDHARLVLLGDPDQLASVEPGAVLADICEAARGAGGRTPLGASWVALGTRHRFGAASGLVELLEAVQGEGDPARPALEVLEDPARAGLRRVDLEAPRAFHDAIRERAVEGHGDYLGRVRACRQGGRWGPDEVAALFEAFRRFTILCALRRGPYGADAVNRAVEQALARTVAPHARPGDAWYLGRPVMVTRNDHVQRLYNGDLGLVVEEPLPRAGPPRRWVAFPDRSEPDGFRRVSTPRLPPCETAYAVTVHKSQGSEYDTVVLVLADGPNRGLTRELLYTGISRARRSVEVWTSARVFSESCARLTVRASGLRGRLMSPEAHPG